MSVRRDLNQRVAIKAQSVTTDTSGMITEAFTTTTATVWAEVIADSAGERGAGSQVEQARTYTVRIRHRTDVAATARLTWGSLTLKVLGMKNSDEGRKRFLLLKCEEAPA